MADKKISELNSLTGANAANGDLVAIVDVSATETKKITRSEFFKSVPSIDGGIVFNEGGADVDFRIESDTNAYAFFLQGSDGYVGIGTVSPAEKLEVTGNIILDATDANIKIKSGVTGTAGAVNFTFNSDSTAYGSLSLPYDTRSSVGLLVQSASAYPVSIASGAVSSATNAVILSTSGQEAMRVNYLGRVGIGTASPTALLDVDGDALVNSLTVGLGAGSVATNTVIGYQSLVSNTTGGSNSANGYQTLYSNTTGFGNTANGRETLYSNTTGGSNIAVGYRALYSSTTSNFNSASGRETLYSNTTGGSNTAAGYQTLYSNTTGGSNSANGVQALYSNTTGDNNTANGYRALYSNTEGGSNVANGYRALYSNTEGNENTANGREALYSNTTGINNTADGYRALYNNTTGSGNTAISPRNSSGTYAPVFDPTTENNRFCMGSTSVTNAYIQVAWTVVSDERDKTELAPVPHGLDFVRALKPTSFRYKADRDSTEGHGPTRYGFLAQEVLALEGDNPVIIDNENPEKLRMTDQSLIAVLVNAIQDQQKIIEGLEQRITALETN